MVVSSVLTHCNRSIWLTTVVKTKSNDPNDKKEPVPGLPGKEIYTDTFDAEVTNSGRNALVLFYSPTCQHCIAFFPFWTELCHLLKDENLDMLKINAKANKWPAFTYPVLDKLPNIYWKFGNKTTPEKFTGEKTIHDIMKFVAHKVDLVHYDKNGNPKPKPKKKK